ncbi:MAG: 16S rRNA (guanine(966)-N(2))-methyltransferase RsmD [Smithellaceae bacterium]|jgi:16S rRNA (guanine966-N2)-methyltransferase|nr:16S rRNA (guanine(966)-N(2))-methyltransferase RsmD [Smithellaceae bacterium]
MRISGGEVKGRTLKFPSRSTQRPTTDFLRETLFNVLGSLADQVFLDLYAGSGSVGLEAASRKAKKVVFVEKNRELIGTIRENVSWCGYADRCLIIHADIQTALRDLYRKKSGFDVIFADPPYNRGFIGETLRLLTEYPVYGENGFIVLQHSRKEQPPLSTEWFITDQRKYGDNLLTLLRMGSA